MATEQPALGLKGGKILAGKEATAGTPVARTQQIDTLSSALSQTSESMFVPTIPTTYNTKYDRYDNVKTTGGNFEVPVRYEGLGIYLEELFGSKTTTEVATFAVTSANKYFDFKEDAGSALVGTVAESTYQMGSSDADSGSLCAAIKTALEATGSGTYSVTFSNTTKKITIAVSGAITNVQFLWKTGTHGSDNTDDHIGTLIGFDDTADSANQASHVADNEVITVFSHVFKLSDVMTEGLTLEKQIDDALTDGKVYLYPGTKITSMSFTQGIPDPLQSSINVVCIDETKDNTPTTGLSTSIAPLAEFHQPTTTWEGADISCKITNFSFEINREKNGARHRTCSLLPKQALFNAKTVVSGTLTLEYDSDTAAYHTAFINKTEQDFDIKYNGPEIKPGFNYEMQFDCPITFLNGFPVNPEGQDQVIVEMPFVSTALDSDNREMTITIQNTIASW